MLIKLINKKVIVIFVAVATTLFFAPGFVNAQEGDRELETERTKTTTLKTEDGTQSNTQERTTIESKIELERTRREDSATKLETAKNNREERKELARERLDAVKLKVCQKREAQVNTIMDRVVVRSQGHIDRITAISDRTKAFYEKQGNTLDNYATLVASVETSRLAAKTAVDALSTDANFSCESDGPKAYIQGFRNQRLTKIAAVGAYRDAVKALVKAVKSVQGTTSKEVQR